MSTEERPFSSRQTIDVFLLRPIAKNETVLHQLALDRVDRPDHARIRRRQKSESTA